MKLLQELTALNESEGFKLGKPLADADIEDVLDSFIDYAIEEGFNAQEDPDEGTDYLIDQMRSWLEDGKYSDDEIEEYMDKHADAIYEHIYAGLT